MMFNFFANQSLFYALASGRTELLRHALDSTKDIPYVAQWAWFLRNHDEIDLGRLTDTERQFVYSRFGLSPDMQLYDRGIRRRLAPMLHKELGMGDDLRLKERLSVRTPMQWSAAKNAGFSSADHPLRPVVTGEYGYERLNVGSEEGDSSSWLEHVRRFAALRRECPEIGLGKWSPADTSNTHLLMLVYQDGQRKLLIIHNFDSVGQRVAVPVGSAAAVLDLMTRENLRLKEGKVSMTLPGYGYRWLRVIN